MNNIKLRGQMSKCIACSKVFTTVANFDKHRVGPHAKGQRRCLSEDELKRIGMVQNAKGVWRDASASKPKSVYRNTHSSLRCIA
jgi:hypothetical protein